MSLVGRLLGEPGDAVVAGDVRANENVSLTATHTLFAREHNRIVAALPRSLSDDEKFEIARRVVGAEQQYITYNEFLPALGIRLSSYHGYDRTCNAAISNEFAVVGFRAHSMIHGEFEPSAPAGTYTPAELEAFEAEAWRSSSRAIDVVLVVPLNLAFGNPDLLRSIGLGPVLTGHRQRAPVQERRADRQPVAQRALPGSAPGRGPAECLDGPSLPECFTGVTDLAALDIERGRDHGMPSYNALRRAYGLRPKSSFTAITGETTDRFPDDPESTAATRSTIRTSSTSCPCATRPAPTIPLGSPEAEADAVQGRRRTTLAARLRGIYGDAASSTRSSAWSPRRHVRGTEFGELQLAIWKKQFEACATATASSTRPTRARRHRTALWDLLPANPGAGDRDEHAGRRPAQRLPRGLSCASQAAQIDRVFAKKANAAAGSSESRSFSSGSRLSGTVERRTAVAVDDYGTVKRMRCRVPASTRS